MKREIIKNNYEIVNQKVWEAILSYQQKVLIGKNVNEVGFESESKIMDEVEKL